MVGFKADIYGIPKNSEAVAGAFQHLDLDKAPGHCFLRGHRSQQHKLNI
jgi:hypothetical protein